MRRRNFFKISLPGIAGLNLLSCTGSFSPDQKIKDGKVIERQKQTEIKGKYDIVVCGAGPAGVCAAITAARSGVRTLLIEVNGCLGGTWTAGLLSWILDWQTKDGLIAEITTKLVNSGATPDFYTGNNFPFEVEKMKVLLEGMCRETGNIDILLHTRLVDVMNVEGSITHVITESKSGREAWEGKIHIDCTGDGDLAALAGCEIDIGDPESGVTQPFTLLSMISGVTYKEIEPFVRKKNDKDSKKKVLEEMNKAGLNPSIKIPGIFPVRDDLFMVMFNHIYERSGINARDVTLATIDARAETNKLVEGLKSLGGPWRNLYLVATAEHIGIREARRIKGLYTVTKEDLMNGKRHDDAVCQVNFGVDIHSLKQQDENSDKRSYSRGIKTKPYDIPLRSLISKDIPNLMMAGRNISGDFITSSSYRVSGNAAKLGEEAGKHAANCIVNNELPASPYKHFKL